MTEPRTVPFPHLGGPYDGDDFPVHVDTHGVPQEIHHIDSLGAPNMLIDPTRGMQSAMLRDFYDREPVLTADGVGFVYRHRAQTTLSAADIAAEVA